MTPTVLDDPDLHTPPLTDPGPGWGQSLANGALGPALLHLTAARAGLGSEKAAQTWLEAAARTPVSSHPDGSLYCGAAALAYVLHATTPAHPAVTELAPHIEVLVRTRLDAAHDRINTGHLPAPAEFDVIHGLTGIGAHLLARAPHSALTAEVLAYLVCLTRPLYHDGQQLPGWWSLQAPLSRGGDFAGGHANLGMAHGISGPLALLSLAQLRGVTVAGQREAIARICSWMDDWRTTDTAGTAWPRWITRPQYRGTAAAETNPMRLAWCYGTPGQARAHHLAALATGDDDRRAMAVDALAACAADTDRIVALDGSLCHGRAGLLQTLRRAAADDPTAALARHLPDLEDQARAAPCTGTPLLEGSSGKTLALLPATAHATVWDACLLITG